MLRVLGPASAETSAGTGVAMSSRELVIVTWGMSLILMKRSLDGEEKERKSSVYVCRTFFCPGVRLVHTPRLSC